VIGHVPQCGQIDKDLSAKLAADRPLGVNQTQGVRRANSPCRFAAEIDPRPLTSRRKRCRNASCRKDEHVGLLPTTESDPRRGRPVHGQNGRQELCRWNRANLCFGAKPGAGGHSYADLRCPQPHVGRGRGARCLLPRRGHLELSRDAEKSIRRNPDRRETSRPRCAQLHINNATIERLVALLTAQPRELLLIVNELSGLFTNMSSYSGGEDNETASPTTARYGTRGLLPARVASRRISA
jgi:hypothetical protein